MFARQTPAFDCNINDSEKIHDAAERYRQKRIFAVESRQEKQQSLQMLNAI